MIITVCISLCGRSAPTEVEKWISMSSSSIASYYYTILPTNMKSGAATNRIKFC